MKKAIGGFIVVGSGTEVWLLGWYTTAILILSCFIIGYGLWKLFIAYASHKTKANSHYDNAGGTMKERNDSGYHCTNSDPNFKSEISPV